MVRHGAGQLLVELVSHTDPDTDADVRKRVSAAFRNLLCVSVRYVFFYSIFYSVYNISQQIVFTRPAVAPSIYTLFR